MYQDIYTLKMENSDLCDIFMLDTESSNPRERFFFFTDLKLAQAEQKQHNDFNGSAKIYVLQQVKSQFDQKGN